MRALKWSFAAFTVYSLLTIIAWCVDEIGWKRGVTEGSYQLFANLLSTTQYVFKALLGLDDVVNYTFRVMPFLLGAFVWILVAIGVCRLIQRKSRSF